MSKNFCYHLMLECGQSVALLMTANANKQVKGKFKFRLRKPFLLPAVLCVPVCSTQTRLAGRNAIWNVQDENSLLADLSQDLRWGYCDAKGGPHYPPILKNLLDQAFDRIYGYRKAHS